MTPERWIDVQAAVATVLMVGCLLFGMWATMGPPRCEMADATEQVCR